MGKKNMEKTHMEQINTGRFDPKERIDTQKKPLAGDMVSLGSMALAREPQFLGNLLLIAA